MAKLKTIENLKKTMLLSIVVLFGFFSLIEYYNVVPETPAAKEQSSNQDEPIDKFQAFSAFEAIVPVFNSNIIQTVVLVFTLDLAFELDIQYSVEVADYKSDYQRLLFSKIIAPNAP